MEKKSVFDISGKAALVTGAALGIGFGIAKRFVEEGADVLLADVNEKALKDAAAQLKGPGKAVTMVFDLAKDADWEKAIQACVKNFGRLDILINNAGIYPMMPMLKMDPVLFDRILSINLRGTAFLSKAAALRMIQQDNGGHIINITSVDSMHPSFVGLAAYDASKGGMMSFTKNLALELAPHRILVNAIAPGGIATEGTATPPPGSSVTAQQLKDQLDWFRDNKIPMKRMGVPDDIAKVAVFLASNAANYITGATLVVDGGMLLT